VPETTIAGFQTLGLQALSAGPSLTDTPQVTSYLAPSLRPTLSRLPRPDQVLSTREVDTSNFET